MESSGPQTTFTPPPREQMPTPNPSRMDSTAPEAYTPPSQEKIMYAGQIPGQNPGQYPGQYPGQWTGPVPAPQQQGGWTIPLTPQSHWANSEVTQQLMGEPAKQEKEKRICGARLSTCLLSIALVVVIIVAAVGGGVGGSMAVQNAKQEACASQNGSGNTFGTSAGPVTVTVTRTVGVATSGTATSSANSAATGGVQRFSAPTTGYLAIDCPALSDTDHVIQLGEQSWTFNARCGFDMAGQVDILAIVSYSFNDCMRACASHNRNMNSNICKGVEWNSNLGFVPPFYGNCWLKNNTDSLSVNTRSGVDGPNGQVAGFLKDSKF